MKVFISWSGEKSKGIAEIIRKWLPGVIQAVKPYFSPDDIAKGTRWNTEISKELSESKLGLICLTRENFQAPWILFEAGALSKNLEKSKVCPLLFDLEPTDIEGPLVQFQASKFEKSEMKRVVTMINAELVDGSLQSDVLESVFEMWWPRLEKDVTEQLAKQKTTSKSSLRTERDLLEEILQLTRSSVASSRTVHPGAIEDLVIGFEELVRSAIENDCLAAIEHALVKLGRPIEYFSDRRFSGNPEINSRFLDSKSRVAALNVPNSKKVARLRDITNPKVQDTEKEQ